MALTALSVQLLQQTDAIARERMFREAAGTPDHADSLLHEARGVLTVDPEEALRYAALAAEIALRRSDPHAEAHAHRVRAQSLRALHRHADALQCFELAATCARLAGDALLEAQLQVGRIDSLDLLGRHSEAHAFARGLVSRLDAVEVPEDVARVLVNIGNLYARRDQYGAALEHYAQALAVLASSSDSLTVARARSNCAVMLTHLGRIEDAFAHYEAARRAFHESGHVEQAAAVEANIGFLHFISGAYAAALSSLTQARQALVERNQSVDAARAEMDLGDVYRALNLFPEALACYEHAGEVFAGVPLGYESACAALGNAAVLGATGRRSEAHRALDRAEALFRAQKNAQQGAHVRLTRSYLLRTEGDHARACSEAAAAAVVFSRAGLKGWAAEANYLPAAIGLEQMQSAEAAMRAVSRAARASGRGWLECRAEHALGVHALRSGDITRGLRHLRAAVEALEGARTLVAPEEMHVAFVRDKLEVYEDIVAALLARGRPRDVAEALQFVERSRSRLLLERVQRAMERGVSLYSAAASQDADVHERLRLLRAELSRRYHQIQTLEEGDPRRLIGAAPGGNDTLEQVEIAYRNALREIEITGHSARRGVFHAASGVTARQLCDTLAPHETLIEFYAARGQVSAFVVTQADVRALRNIISVEAIEHLGRRLRYHIQKAGTLAEYVASHSRQLLAGMRCVLTELYDSVLGPLEPILAAERLILAPHGVLHGLPIHAAFDGEQYALDRWECLYTPSAAVWHVVRARNRARRRELMDWPSTALLMGVPEPGIAQVSMELEQLAALLPNAEIFTRDRATLDAFRAHCGRSRLIHLATHALFRADNPLFSALRLADGWLLARDLYDLALDCDLATLSACRTGMAAVEPGDELFGLSRGFLAAGARALAVSLWPADDRATAELMGRFYQSILMGTSCAAALRAAQIAVRELYPHPYHWAAFCLVGET